MIFPSWLVPSDMGPTPILLVMGLVLVVGWFVLPRTK